jgi:antitoxin component of MazEF toxin-antitoxin module
MQVKENPDFEYRTIGVVGSASFCVVLPKQYAINLGVGKGDFVKVRQEGERIIIEKDG